MDLADGHRMLVELAVGEVEPGHVHARFDHRRQGFARAGRRADRADDLGLGLALAVSTKPSCRFAHGLPWSAR
jgi:hypothetical protein